MASVGKAPYLARQWYWSVKGTTGSVWNSATLSYVSISDATYVAWLSRGNKPSVVDSAQSLLIIMLSQVGFPQRLAITSSGTPALNGTYAITKDAMARINYICTMIANGKPLPPGSGTTFQYASVDEIYHTFTSANFLALASAINTYLYQYEIAMNTKVTGGTATLPTTPIAI